MDRKFYDLHVCSKDIENTLEIAERLGWSGICIADTFEKNFSEFSEKLEKLKGKSKIEIFIGAEITKNVKKNAIEALKFSDFILANCTDEETKRNASDCWEVDILCQENLRERRISWTRKIPGLTT